MDVSFLFKIIGAGILIAVSYQILQRAGRDEQATFVTIAGILVTLMLLITQIRELFDLIVSVFGM